MGADNDSQTEEEAKNTKQTIKSDDIDDLVDLNWGSEPVVKSPPAAVPHINNVLDDLLSLNSTNGLSHSSGNTHDQDDIITLFGSPPLLISAATTTASSRPFC
ncbi:hypothetical protein MAM1_0211c08067 [Mucor ambiguus]|uniref:Uncharacterized protein n=1 Tax=Mucor ambiguus TaxID=91626 RepID=A0A0C9N1T6_9FUNG|nr:hypothetical protein MAM1_0211c08067 [Mucor ambiguus]